MDHLLRTASAIILLAALSAAHPPGFASSSTAFEPAEILAATDIPYPIQSVAIGTVVLEVTVSNTGDVEAVQPIREIQSLTDVAIDSVRDWSFKPASLNGTPIRSRTTVAVTFNPPAIPAANVPLPPVTLKFRASDPVLEPDPVEVLAAAFPQYPANSLAIGTVVLRLTVGKNGKVEDTEAVRKIASLTSPCIRVVKEWRFKPAELQGKPLRSSIALAFVLRPPLTEQ